MKYKVLFTADIHGNVVQYQKLVDYAREISADAVMIGGDIAPKDLHEDEIITGQRHFLNKRLPKILKPLKRELPDSKIFLIMGNDDCAVNLDVLKKNDPTIFQVIHQKRVKLTEDFDIVGYPFVPITPFGIKDWEKYDLSTLPNDYYYSTQYPKRKDTNYMLAGFKSTRRGWRKFTFKPEMEKTNSIQKDMSKPVFFRQPRKTVYLFHTPPDNTDLDMDSGLRRPRYLGSFAVRHFIEKHQSYLTLHGHIHFTVEYSGNFKHHIGKTLCMTAGNDDIGRDLKVLTFDLYSPENAARHTI